MKNRLTDFLLSEFERNPCSFWFGKWWVCIWCSKHREINIGIGDDLGVGCFGPFSIRNYRKGIFWLSVAKPTLKFLTSEISK